MIFYRDWKRYKSPFKLITIAGINCKEMEMYKTNNASAVLSDFTDAIASQYEDWT